MGKSGSRLPSFCLNQITMRVRMRPAPPPPPPPSIELKPATRSNENDTTDLQPSVRSEDEKEGGGGVGGYVGRRVMVVVESSGEAKCALQWALSHAIQSSDTVVLLDVVKPSKNGEQTEKERDPKDYELLNSMRSICQAKRPEVQTELSIVQGKDRGPTIVDEARKLQISLLVLGQKWRPSITWRLLLMWAGSRMVDPACTVADYCVQNSTCMALAVRRKSRRGGGYLITTRRHKDFWLLA